MNTLVFDVRTAFLVLALVGFVQALGSWLALRASVGGPLGRSQKLWVAASTVAACMGMTIAFRSSPAAHANLLISHGFMVLWLGLCWTTLGLEQGFTPRVRTVLGLMLASLLVYGTALGVWGEARATPYPTLVAMVGALLVARPAWAIQRSENSGGARVLSLAFFLTALALLVRLLHLLGSPLPQTSVSSGLSQLILTLGGISVFVLGSLGYLRLQIERLTAARLAAEVSQARAEERGLQAQERVRVMQDIIDERDLLIRRLKRLDAFQQQAVLAAALPHELRQPLGAMRLNLDALARSLSGGAGVSPQLVRDLDQDTQRLCTMVDDFMALITSPASSEASAVVPLDIGSMLHSVLDVVKPRAQMAAVEFRLQLHEKVCVNACPVSLQQVMLILLTNALDAVSDQSGPRWIAIELVQTPHELQLGVRDSGPGIPDHVRPYLFEPFASSKPHGLGIGLALARRLAWRFGARLSAPMAQDPSLIAGATIVVHLPRPTQAAH